MPDVIDLSNLKKPHPDAQQAPQADGEDLPKSPVRTAFLIIQQSNGVWSASPDLNVANQIDPKDVATGDDLVAGLNVLLTNLQAEKAASMTAAMLQQAAMQQMQAMQNQQIAANLKL